MSNTCKDEFIDFCEAGDYEKVNQSLSSDPDLVNIKVGDLKKTPLHYAAQRGHHEICQYLIENGAAVDARDMLKKTPLHYAAQRGYHEICQYLIKIGAAVNARDEDEWAPIHYAAERGHREVCQCVIENGAFVDARDELKKTPLHYAAEEGHREICECLFENGAAGNARDKLRKTPLHYAANKGHCKICQCLIENSSAVNACDELNKTPLHYAANEGHCEICQCLIENSAAVNAGDEDDWVPLHYAAERGHHEVCQCLIENGAAIYARDKSENTPLHFAAQAGHHEICQCLIKNGAAVDPRDEYEVAPLHYAAQRGHHEICQCLIENGAAVGSRDVLKKTPLHYAAYWGRGEICQCFIENGAAVNACDELKKTPLHYAADRGRSEVCQRLIENGAAVDARDEDGLTPAEVARRNGFHQLERMLPTFHLVRFGTVKPNCVVLRLAGPPGSGKSTVTETLSTGRMAGFFRWENQADTGTANSKQRTKGMRCVKFLDETSSEFMIMDLGGHDEFFASHQTLMSFEDTPAINGIVLSSLMDKEDMQREAMKWASFYACRTHPDSTLQPLLFIMTRQDMTTLHEKKNATEVFVEVKAMYNSYFDIPDQPLFIDARKSWDQPMKELRRKLSELWKQVLETAAPQPAICQLIEDVLQDIITSTAEPIITKDAFQTMMLIDDTRKLRKKYDLETIKAALTREILDQALMHLTRLGKVVSFLNPALQDHLIIVPSWLYVDLVGRLLSEPPLPPPYIRYVNGCAKRKDAIDTFANVHPNITGEFVLKMLAERGLLIDCESDEMVMVLFKLTAMRPLELWQPVAEHERSAVVYLGRRKVYSKAAGLSLAVFPLLQWRLYHLFLEEEGAKMPMWKDGIRIVSQHYDAEAIVERRPEIHAVDAISRGKAADCQQLLRKLLGEVTAMVDEWSPGSLLQHYVLSPRELAQLPCLGSSAAPKVQYEQLRVEKAYRDSTFVTDEVEKGSAPERVEDLFLFPEEISSSVPSACAACCPDGDESGRSASSMTDDELLKISLIVAEHLGSLEQCIKLAVQLHVASSEMATLKHLHHSSYQTMHAIHMMNSWYCQQQSPGEAYLTLQSALANIQRQDIIQMCRQSQFKK